MRLKIGDDTYDLSWNTLLIAEAKFVKKHTGMTVPEFSQGFEALDPDALQAGIYLAKKRAGEIVRYEDLEDIDIADIDILPDDDEADDDGDDGEVPTGDVEAEESGTSTSSPNGTNGSAPSPTTTTGIPTPSTS